MMRILPNISLDVRKRGVVILENGVCNSNILKVAIMGYASDNDGALLALHFKNFWIYLLLANVP